MHGALPSSSSRDRFGLAKFASPHARIPRLKPRVHFAVFYLLAALVLTFAYAHRSIHDKHDPYKCHALLTQGQWLDPPATGRSSVGFQRWQPDGCMLRGHSSSGVAKCLESDHGRDAVFIGDSTVREIFWAAARKLNPELATKQKAGVKEKHAGIHFKHETTTLNFIWDPFLNSSKTMDHVSASRLNAAKPNRPELPHSKALVVVGGGLWFARETHGVALYKERMEKIATHAHQEIHHDVHSNPGANRVFFLPVVPPFYVRLDREHAAKIRHEDVDDMNKFIHDLPVLYNADVLSSFLKMAQGAAQIYQSNGLHVTEKIADVMAEVIFNARCNNRYREYPYTGNCCYDYPTALIQKVLIATGIIGVLIVASLEIESRFSQTSYLSKLESVKNRLPLLRPVLIVWAALVYCWAADRTHLFNKIGKQYNNVDFFVFCLGIVLMGALSIRASSPPAKANQEKPETSEQPFLSRDQTDEWKGWMQALILAYHYTGASKVLWIYRIVRLLVASYLFMSGYGHAAYFYQKKDFSVRRMVAINLRLNLLSVLLPWMMGTDYLFYYFAPLVTYWYAVVYLTMRIKSNWNEQLPYFLGKVGAAALTTTILHTQPRVFKPAFAVINFVFGSKWETREWLFRCALDQYIVYAGMVVAVLYVRQSNPPPPPAPPQDGIAATAHTNPGRLLRDVNITTSHLYMADALALIVYIFASTSQSTKTSSNAVHTYVSPLAVLAFVHLRNATPSLRNHYSAAFAWLGKVSLETFILQYHIWLAADTRGLLSTGMFGQGGMSVGINIFQSGMGFGRWTDCILIGTVFIWVSWHVAKATAAVTSVGVKLMFGDRK